MENEAFVPKSKCSIFHDIFEYIVFQRRQKVLFEKMVNCFPASGHLCHPLIIFLNVGPDHVSNCLISCCMVSLKDLQTKSHENDPACKGYHQMT